MTRRQLGNSQLWVCPLGFGCWPIAGVSTLDVNEADSLATIHAAIDGGINFIDTAYSYGYNGESDHLLAEVLKDRRAEVIVASKVGQSFSATRERVVDARPDVLLAHTETALTRLGVEQIDLLYLHQPDPNTSLEESAAAIAKAIEKGWARYAAVSNVNAQQLETFHQVCPVVCVQPPFNMLQQGEVQALRQVCQRFGISIVCYWALMKGLLTGKFARDAVLDPRDKRRSYAVFQGRSWEQAQDLLDQLRTLAAELNCTVTQLVLAWTIAQDSIRVALVGAKRAEQIIESCQAMHLKLDLESRQRIDRAIVDCGFSQT